MPLCPSCGEKSSIDAQFCPKCGMSLHDQGQYSSLPQIEPGYEGEERPIAAIIVSSIAGVLIILNGLLILAIGTILFLFVSGPGILFVLLGLLLGLVVIVAAWKLYSQPEEHVTWGIVVLLFSFASIIVGGGFIVGLIIGIVGGILGIVWKPLGVE